MENHTESIQSLIDKTVAYGKSSIELTKLRALDKTSDVVSSILPHSVVFVLVFFMILFFSLGSAFWLGDIIGHIYYGLFIVAAFYALTALIVRLFFYRKIKIYIQNSIIRFVQE